MMLNFVGKKSKIWLSLGLNLTYHRLSQAFHMRLPTVYSVENVNELNIAANIIKLQVYFVRIYLYRIE